MAARPVHGEKEAARKNETSLSDLDRMVKHEVGHTSSLRKGLAGGPMQIGTGLAGSCCGEALLKEDFVNNRSGPFAGQVDPCKLVPALRVQRHATGNRTTKGASRPVHGEKGAAKNNTTV